MSSPTENNLWKHGLKTGPGIEALGLKMGAEMANLVRQDLGN